MKGRRPSPHVVISAAYLLVGLLIVKVSYSLVFADGVSYIQVARHYVAGDFDLAINSYWGPLISWLLVPLVAVGIDPVLGFKLLNVLFGLVAAFGVGALVRRLSGPDLELLGFAAMLLLVLRMLAAPLTPDLLLTAVMAWYFASAMLLVRQPTAGQAAVTGVLGGVAYLAKGYALMFVLAHLLLLGLLGFLLGDRSALRKAVRRLPIVAGALALIAVPWVAAISVHDRRLTTGSTARLNLIWSPIEERGGELPYVPVQPVRSGRLTVWENPVEIAAPDPDTMPIPRAGVIPQIMRIATNASRAEASLRAADGLGLLLLGCVVSAVLLLVSLPSVRTPDGSVRLSAIAAVLLYVGGYLLVRVEMRFFWPVWGLMLALALDVVCAATEARARGIAGAPGPGGEGASTHGAAGTSGAIGAVRPLCLALALVLIAGFAFRSTGALMARYVRGEYRQADRIRHAASALGPARRAASNQWERGLVASFWSGVPFLGAVRGRDPQEIGAELGTFGKTRLLIFDDAELADGLVQTSGFREVTASQPPNRSLRVLQFDPPSGGPTLRAP